MLFNPISSPMCSSPTRKGVREPLTHKITDRKISRDNRTRNHEITTEYSSFCLTLSLLANSETNLEHCSPIPPFVPKTSGVKLPCWTSRILSLYSRFLACSCFLNIVDVFLFWLEGVLTCVILTSKNAVCPRLQKSPAFTSKRAPSSVFGAGIFHSWPATNVAPSRHLRKLY